MVYIDDDALVIKFPDLHPNAGVRIDLQRTLRLPDDGKDHPLPPGLGSFPLRHIEDYDLAENNDLKSRGGVIMPMFQADALWLNFNPIMDDYDSVEYPLAIKIGTGKLCAISGNEWSSKLRKKPQNYIVVPEQPWLDGYNVSDGTVRQFVAAPLGDGVTAEEQIRGTSDIGGIQIQVFPMKRSYYDELNSRELAPAMSINYYKVPTFDSAEFMGLAAGGKMEQEISKDPHKMAAWDKDVSERCFITIANARQWMAMTGEEPPLSPINADEYTRAGLPWFSYYNDDTKAIEGAKVLGGLKSFQKAYADQGEDKWSKEKVDGPSHVIPVGKRTVSTGEW